jgi:mRNA interferase HigB
MRVISRARLREFWEIPGCQDSEGPLRAWYTHVSDRSVAWRTWSDVKAAFATASQVGNCVVFNIGGNKYRLVTRVLYPSQKVFVLKVMTHVEYDKDQWKEDCGCYTPPPAKPRKMKPPASASNRRQRGV